MVALGSALRFLSKIWWTLTLQLHPIHEPSIQQIPPNPGVFAPFRGSHGFHQQRLRNTKRHCWKNVMPNSKRQHTQRGRRPLGKMARNRSFLGGMIFAFRWFGWKDGPNSKWMKTSMIERLKQKSWMSGISQTQQEQMEVWFFFYLPNLLTSPCHILNIQTRFRQNRSSWSFLGHWFENLLEILKTSQFHTTNQQLFTLNGIFLAPRNMSSSLHPNRTCRLQDCVKMALDAAHALHDLSGAPPERPAVPSARKERIAQLERGVAGETFVETEVQEDEK